MAENKAKELLWPSESNILVRFIFLYVGQGASTIVLVKSGDTYESVLVDINLDAANGGVNVPTLMCDLLDGNDLDVFVNTHPHDDHLKGILELQKNMGINEIWHSGHKPGKKYDDAYKDLMKAIDKVEKAGGRAIILEGSDEEKTIGDANYYILAPAEYVTDDVNDEDADTRYNRIHEQCVVLKFGIESAWGLIPGDADRNAFENYITKHHKDRLKSTALAASHHGSRTFFRYDEEDEPYHKALDEIDPSFVIISAPKQGESKHDHPHDDAVGYYNGKVGSEKVYHTGKERYCYIFDIFQDGTYSDEVQDDQGEMAKTYNIDGGDDGSKKGQPFKERKDKTNITPNRYA